LNKQIAQKYIADHPNTEATVIIQYLLDEIKFFQNANHYLGLRLKKITKAMKEETK
jgi:hypothetical protein